MTLRVPLTLTIIPALTRVDRRPAFRDSALGDRRDRPRQWRIGRRSTRSAGRGSRPSAASGVPQVCLADILGLDSDVEASERKLIVLRPAGGDVYALAVDRIHDHEELVVKPAAPAVMATGLYAGTTLADDGSPILLLDPAGLAEVGGVKLEALERAARIADGPASRAVARDRGPPVPRPRRRPPGDPPGGRRPHRGSRPPTAIRKAAGQLRVQLGEAILPLAGATTDELGERQGPPVPPQRRQPGDRLCLRRSDRFRDPRP